MRIGPVVRRVNGGEGHVHATESVIIGERDPFQRIKWMKTERAKSEAVFANVLRNIEIPPSEASQQDISAPHHKNEVTDLLTGESHLVEDRQMMFLITPLDETFPGLLGMKSD